MLRLFLVAVYLLNVCVGQHFLDPITQSHLEICYNDTRYTLGRHLPPFSLDNLLAIVEKIESHPYFGDVSATNVATFLLKRFRVDGIVSERISERDPTPHYEIEPKEYNRGHMILSMLSHQDFRDVRMDFLTSEEKCALHWMLSHSINKTRMNEEDDLNWRPMTPSPFSRKRRYVEPIQQRSEFSKFPRESGVIFTPSGEAIAIGSVLAGIALMRDSRSMTLKEVESKVTSVNLQDERIRKLDAATYAINLALDATNKKLFLGPRGMWNDSICPNEYTLNEPATSVPDALLFGSFDGFFIGSSVGKSYSEKIYLSQILRMYYSTGFKYDQDNRACNRIKQMKSTFENAARYEDMVREISRAIVIFGHSLGGERSLDRAEYTARALFDNIKKNYTDNNFNFPSQQECEVLSSNIEPKVYPLIDLYIILDSAFFQSQARYDEMASFVTNVASYLDISKNASHIGLYIENRNLFDSFMPINASMSVAEWKCKVQQFDRTKFYVTGHSDQTIETIRILKQMFINKKYHNRETAGRPGEVILFLRTGGVHNSDEVRWEMEHFTKDHPEIKVMGSARSRGDVEPFIGRDNHEDYVQFFTGTIAQMRQVAANFFKLHLRRVGATIYYPNCESESRGHHELIGYLPPYSRQFYTMPSSMFNLSTELKIDVRPHGVALQACISRSEDLFRPNKRPTNDQCQELLTTSGFPNVLFSGHPCEDHEAGRCPPFYIQIKRKDQMESGECASYSRTGENLCRTYDDVRYTIRVEGGRCSGCIVQITFSMFILCIIALLL